MRRIIVHATKYIETLLRAVAFPHGALGKPPFERPIVRDKTKPIFVFFFMKYTPKGFFYCKATLI